MDLKQDIAINMYALHEEWKKQPELYARWAEAHCDAIAKRDSHKIKCDIKHSMLSTDIRNNYGRYGLDKRPTEGQVEAIINENAEYQRMLNEMTELNRQVNLLQAGRTALEHKKRALEGLERLRLADYFGTVVSTDMGRDASASHMAEKQAAALSGNDRLRKLQNR